jgi:hypothetical protein
MRQEYRPLWGSPCRGAIRDDFTDPTQAVCSISPVAFDFCRLVLVFYRHFESGAARPSEADYKCLPQEEWEMRVKRGFKPVLTLL